MFGFPLGILSAAGAGGVVAGDYELISTTILGSSQPSVTFSNLGDYSSTYKHLQIRAVARTNRADITDEINIRINADTGSNYNSHWLRGNGSTVTSAAQTQTNMNLGIIDGDTATASAFGVVVFDLLDVYSTTKNKTVRALGGHKSTGSNILLTSGLWRNTAAVSSVTVGAGDFARSFLSGSRFSIYGIKG